MNRRDFLKFLAVAPLAESLWHHRPWHKSYDDHYAAPSTPTPTRAPAPTATRVTQMGLLPVLGAAVVQTNFESLAFEIPYTDDDDNTACENTIDLPTVATTALANSGATSISISALPVTVPDNTYIVFWNGVRVLTSAQANKGATSISVDATSGAIPSGTKAYISNVFFKKTSDTNYRQFLPFWRTALECILKVDLAAGGTSLQIDQNVGGVNGLWQAGGTPFDVFVESERITVGAVGGTGNQTFSSLTRNVNGAGDVLHKAGVRISRVGGTVAKAFYGSIFPLEPATSYDVILKITDGADEQSVSFSATTRTEFAAVGAANRFVNARTGNDANDGLGTGTAWKTLDKAIEMANAASATLTIEFEGGYYKRTTRKLTQASHRIILKAATSATCVPATDGATNPAPQVPSGFSYALDNPGVPMIYDKYAAPTGSGEGAADWARGFAGTAPWTSAVINGTTLWYLDIRDTAGAYDNQEVTHLTYSPVSGSAYAAAKADIRPRRVGKWADDDAALGTVTGFAEMVRTNKSYNAGAYQDLDGAGTGGSNTSPSRMFIRMPGDTNPNDYYWWIGSGLKTEDTASTGVIIAADPGLDPGHRILGLAVRGMACGFRIEENVQNTVIDMCATHTCGMGAFLDGNNTAGATGEISGTLVQRCWFFDSDIWSLDSLNDRRIPWHGIKQAMILSDDTEYENNRVLFAANSHGVFTSANQCRQCIRSNHFEGMFNGVPTGNVSVDKGDNYNQDVYNNTFELIMDNPLEPAGPAINYKAWSNSFLRSTNILESDCQYGPIYIVRSSAWQLSSYWLTDDGHSTAPDIGAGEAFKYGANLAPRPRVWIVHLTCWNNLKHPHGVDTKAFVSGVAASHLESFVILNSIIRMKNTITTFRNNGIWLVDEANLYGTTVGALEYDGRGFSSTNLTGANTLDEWRKWDNIQNTAAGGTVLRGSLTNKLGGQDYNFRSGGLDVIDAALNDPTNGDLSPKPDLVATQSIVDAGVPVPGFDVPYPGSGNQEPYHYVDLLPDRGGIETTIPAEEPPDPGPDSTRDSDTTRSGNTARTANTARSAR